MPRASFANGACDGHRFASSGETSALGGMLVADWLWMRRWCGADAARVPPRSSSWNVPSGGAACGDVCMSCCWRRSCCCWRWSSSIWCWIAWRCCSTAADAGAASGDDAYDDGLRACAASGGMPRGDGCDDGKRKPPRSLAPRRWYGIDASGAGAAALEVRAAGGGGGGGPQGEAPARLAGPQWGAPHAPGSSVWGGGRRASGVGSSDASSPVSRPSCCSWACRSCSWDDAMRFARSACSRIDGTCGGPSDAESDIAGRLVRAQSGERGGGTRNSTAVPHPNGVSGAPLCPCHNSPPAARRARSTTWHPAVGRWAVRAGGDSGGQLRRGGGGDLRRTPGGHARRGGTREDTGGTREA